MNHSLGSKNAMDKAMIPVWKHVARISFGPERHLTTNVAASEFTTTGSTSAVTANSSRKENENSADRFCWANCTNGRPVRWSGSCGPSRQLRAVTMNWQTGAAKFRCAS
ncbi:hypothetical protein LSAT2_027099 [Lamellibrachia satsuma]|nr:hypothetical protein LSAT2_027099 [Lamellibrachia satsuma]